MITIIIDGNEHIFIGDELTSPEQEVILFLQNYDELGREF